MRKTITRSLILLCAWSLCITKAWSQSCHVCTAAVPLNNGLVACYSFNGNANDESGNGNNGTVGTGTTLTTDRFNMDSAAYNFDASTNSYIQIPASASLNTNNMSGISISIWIKVKTGATFTNPNIVRWQDATRTIELNYSSSMNKLVYLNWNGTSSATLLYSTRTLNFDTWYHAVVKITDNSSQLFINGVLENSSTNSLVKPVNPSLHLGRNPASGWNFSGNIDDLRIYNRLIDSNEMSTLYSLGGNKINAGNDTSVFLGDSVQLNAVGSNLINYSWSPAAGLSNPGIANPKAAPSAPTQYIVTASNGICTLTDTVTVSVILPDTTCAYCTGGSSLNNGLVACYPFNGNANDESGNGNNGTVGTGTTLTTDRFSKTSAAYNFDASANSYIQIPASASLNTNNMSGISISMWFRVTAGATFTNPNIVRWQDTVRTLELSYSSSMNKLIYLNWNGTSSATLLYSTRTLNFGTWYHAVVKITDNSAQLFINGVLENSSTNPLVKPVNPSLHLGRNPASGWNFSGTVDDLRIYNRLLSLDEIGSLYACSSSGKTIPVQTGLRDNLSEKPGMSIYPNPTRNNLFIELSSTPTRDVSIDLYNIAGQKVGSFSPGSIIIRNNNIEIPNLDLKKGIYLVQVRNGETIHKSKLIIE